jgi:hypothetical protein
VPHEWNNDGRWSRSNWELVAVRDDGDSHRKGVYVCPKNATVYITIKGITEFEIVSTPKPYN